MREVVAASPVKPTEDLNQHQIEVLSCLMALDSSVSEWDQERIITAKMRQVGHNELATNIGLLTLEEDGYIESEPGGDWERVYFVYRVTPKGKDWLIRNQDKLKLRVEPQPPQAEPHITDDDVPF